MYLKASNIFIGTLFSLTVLVWGAPVQAVDPPDLIDVVEIVDPAPFITHENILPGDVFMDVMTVKNLTASPQEVLMRLDIDLTKGIISVPNFELEEKLTTRIERVGSGDIVLPGGGTVKKLQQLDDTLINLGTINGNSQQMYRIHVTFDPLAGNEYQNTKVYFNISMTLEINEIQGSLQLFKENDSVGDEAPGNEVKYTLRVTALHGDVDDVTVTDLPPEGFEYIAGSGSGAPFAHEYASPGVWNLGDMEEGETRTLTYRTRISSAQDDGMYRDLAFARGTTRNEVTVLAADPVNTHPSVDPTNLTGDSFVGTQVAVAVNATPTVTVEEDNKDKVIEKTKKKIKYVLGAATTLPLTGANASFLLLALVFFFVGIGLILAGKRRKHLAHSVTNTLMKSFLFALLAGASLLSAQAESAAPLAVRIEVPDTVVGSPDFKIGFVVLDILGRTVEAQCFKESDASPFASYPLAAGGSSGNCQINASVMPTDGDSVFYVKAVTTSGASETAESLPHVNVKLATAPGTPYNYDRDDSSCTNNITFTTADDLGKTVKVELYRSLATSFTADASTFVASQPIGSNVSGSFSVAAPGCNDDYFYALRAVNASEMGSGFVGDKDVNVDTRTVTKTKTTIITTPGAASGGGAIAVTGAGAGGTDGTVEGVATIEEEVVQSETGAGKSVLGEMTQIIEDAGLGFADWVASHPWWSLLGFSALIALSYYAYQAYLRKHNENNQPKW